MSVLSKYNNFLCIFNFKRTGEDFPVYLLKASEDIFKHFGYSINKIHYATEKNNWSPTYERFRVLLCQNNYEYYSVNFYSGKKYSLDSDFFIDIMNYTMFGFSPQCKDLFSVAIVIKEQHLIDNIIGTYIDIVNIFTRYRIATLSGFAYHFSKKYDDACLASGILNGSQKYSYDMYNLTNWIDHSSFKSGTIGYLGVFTNLSDYQIRILNDTFGTNNIYIVNNAVIYNFKNAILNYDCNMNKEDSFFATSEFSELSRLFEHLLSYEKLLSENPIT